MKQYLDLLQHILDHGEQKSDRTGTGTISVFGYQNRYDLRDGFPLVTTKKVYFDSLVRELLWFIKGATNIYDGLSPQTKIWDAWADKDGNLGPIYGYQWRSWPHYEWSQESQSYIKTPIDQLKQLIDDINSNPDSRRLLISAWNVSDIDKMALPPCHTMFQFYCSGDYLDLQLYQRSADVAVGVPFNIASYALLLMMIAKQTGRIPRYFIHTFGDAHIYLNHLDGVKEQLSRTPGKLPQIKIADKSIWDLVFEDFELLNYEHQPFIKFPIAV